MAKFNMQKEKTPMPELPPFERAKCFAEVAIGYSEEEAINEAQRCLDCKDPSGVKGCPVGVRIPDFIREIVKGDFYSAYAIIKETNALCAICGRVCPQENQCEGNCVRGIKSEPVSIGRLERFCADFAAKNGVVEDKNPERITDETPRVAVVGSGPAGLTAAGELAKRGYAVTVYEALHKAGGVLVYGIPEFRLPNSIVERELEALERLGVKIECDTVIGRTLMVDELLERYKAVFIATGAGLPKFMGIKGESAVGVYSANEFLTRVNLMGAGRSVYATPIRKSRSVAVMPARKEEVHHAMEEGIEFLFLSNPTEVLTDEKGEARGLKCIRMALGEPGVDGRRSVKPIEESEFEVEAETVIVALGTSPNPLIKMTTEGLDFNRHGCIVTLEDTVTTTKDGVFAGGDAVTGAATVILAMGAGKKAAEKIDEYIRLKG